MTTFCPNCNCHLCAPINNKIKADYFIECCHDTLKDLFDKIVVPKYPDLVFDKKNIEMCSDTFGKNFVYHDKTNKVFINFYGRNARHLGDDDYFRDRYVNVGGVVLLDKKWE